MLQKYFKAILDNSPDNIVLIGKNHEVMAFNKSIKEVLFEYHKREIQVGDLYYPNFVIEANRKIYLDAFESAINGIPFTIQNLTQHENTSYWFEYKTSPVYDEDELIGVTLSAKNITNEKIAEKKISNMSENIKAILDNTDESITLLDLDYKIITMNQIAFQTTLNNTDVNAIIGMDFRNFMPDKANLFYEYYPKAARGESSLVEIPYLTASGQEVWYQTKFNPVYNQELKLYGVSIFAKDITEKKKLEQSLIESEERFRKIANSAPIGILISDKSLKISYANFYAMKLFKYDSKAFLELYLTDIIEDIEFESQDVINIDNFSMNIENFICNNERFTGISKENDRIEILLSSEFFKSKKQDNIIFIIQDITELNNKNNTIILQNNKLKDIAWHQSHIIRAPLCRLMTIVELLQIDQIDEAEKRYLFDSITTSAQELDNVIKNIVSQAE
ncbi:PAS sensor protein [Emticicia oligotrophica DSM 17448]|uniref:PAS sensor protein n=1 Tax=Emticicia oligotrophica (strain DSM 17448 / CIP 109782 / MTCC 6937 / GPTSA100-15) TaxID=929562 RepID=A0ABN4ANQ0_EMTOG|nr:PAS domain S-box protein [Emticicia oligotrophica]AFK03965.1 PAS sensor protein [Emticicia oligotrophica DSM 17448]